MFGVAWVLTCGARAAGLDVFNEVRFENPPPWVTSREVKAALRVVERNLEWDLRKVSVIFETKADAFEQRFGMPADILAFSEKSARRIVMGPRVGAENFREVLTHELVHHAVAQKFKAAIPIWLEEGLANHWARPGRVPRYELLREQPDFDVASLGHPFRDSRLPPRVHYEASLALAKLLDKRCGLPALLGLAVGRRLQSYLATTCGIENLSGAYRRWVQQ